MCTKISTQEFSFSANIRKKTAAAKVESLSLDKAAENHSKILEWKNNAIRSGFASALL